MNKAPRQKRAEIQRWVNDYQLIYEESDGYFIVFLIIIVMQINQYLQSSN